MIHGVYFHAYHWTFQQVQLSQWFGNIVAGVVVFIAVSLFWPRLRHAIERFVKRHVAAGNAELHAKLDESHRLMRHIIKHSPDIPPMPKEKP